VKDFLESASEGPDPGADKNALDIPAPIVHSKTSPFQSSWKL
jgi:hypothetical protein